MHEEPLRLIPRSGVPQVIADLGIGTFQPKDEKNQDSTELTGDINYRKIAEYGSDSDPRAFNFDGEFNIANRGIIEFIEVLKLDVAFLYDLLGASQEHVIKPKKFAQTDIDEVIIGHTNEPEYTASSRTTSSWRRLRDRTDQDRHPLHHAPGRRDQDLREGLQPERIRASTSPRTPSRWRRCGPVLTRLEEPKKANLTLLQKLKLYNGKDAARLHRGQRQGAAQGGRREGHGRHLPALQSGQDLQRARLGRRRAASTRSWC